MDSITPHGPTPSLRQQAWHEREAYGFVHFTVNTFTDREWGYGDESPGLFRPDELDCAQWVDAAITAGLSGLILTAKHHDGFCLWPTATTDHHIGHTPYRAGGGDIVRELSDACAAGGIAFGVYCSPWDRHDGDYGTDAYVERYHRQWEELLTNYGDLFEVWFDGANGGDGFYGGAREHRSIDARAYYRFDELWSRCHELQPGAVVFSDAGPDVRWCGNESGFTSLTAWSKVRPEGFSPGAVEDARRLADGDADGTVWRPVEVDVSSRPGWFWHEHEAAKSGDELFAIWLASVGRGAGLNLNITPDRHGRIPEADVRSLRRFRSLVDGLCANDVTGNARIAASSTGYGAAESLAGDGGLWASAERDGWVAIDLGETCRIAAVRVEEAIELGQRICGWALDVRVGGAWYEVHRGGTIGARSVVALNRAIGNAVRVRLLQAQAVPVLRRVIVYAAGDP